MAPPSPRKAENAPGVSRPSVAKLGARSRTEIERLAAALADHARSGDLILLAGPLGAGKTTLARAFIRHHVRDPEAEVPSPSYTLVQSYAPPDQTKATVWHYDFYRLENSSEIAELGLDEALADGIVLVEWPEHAGAELPANGLLVSLAPIEDEGRRDVSIRNIAGWADRLADLEARRHD